MRNNAALVVGTTCLLLGCFGSGPTSTTYSGSAPRSDAVLREAERDLGCPLAQLRITQETNRRYVNEIAFRFVVEGCGERAGYVEECAMVGDTKPPGWTEVNGSLACRDVLVTRVRLAPSVP